MDLNLTRVVPFSLIDNLSPRLNLLIEGQNHSTSNYPLQLSEICGEVYVIDGSMNIYAGHAVAESSPITHIGTGGLLHIQLSLELGYEKLSKIEKIRKDQNLRLKCVLKFVCEQAPNVNEPQSAELFLDISKSDWVETILHSFEYKNVLLIELPVLQSEPDMGEIAQNLQKAKQELARGEYSSVLVNCRHALEALKAWAKTKGLTHEVPDSKGKTTEVISFKKIILSPESSAESMSKIYSQLWNFLVPGGPHSGPLREKEDAEFVIFTTYTLINLVFQKYAKQKQ